MLKVTYSENNLYLEYLSQSPEEWISLWVVFALRTNQRLVMESSHASILLPRSLATVFQLKHLLHYKNEGSITLSICDAEHIEVSLAGTWLSFGCEEGIFITVLNPETENLLLKLWQAAQIKSSPIWR